VAIDQKVTENFFVMKKPSLGTYYWRVKSFADNGKASDMSQPSQFSVGP
jgi:hypothetical protein